MAVLLNSGRWLQQPQGPVEIDWEHPLSRGLVFYFVASGMRAELVGGRMPQPFGGGGLNAAKGGVGAYAVNTGTDGVGIIYSAARVQTITTDFTIATEGNLRGMIQNSTLVRAPYNAGTWTAPFHVFGLYRSGLTGSVQIGYGTAASANRVAVFPDGTIQIAPGQRWVASRSGASASLLYNGSLHAPTVSNSFVAGESIGFGTAGHIALLNHNQGSPGEGATGELYYTAIWNRSLSDAEKQEFQPAPYQILRPVRRKLYFGLPKALPSDTVLLDTLGGATGDSLLKEDGEFLLLESALSEGDIARTASSAGTFGKLSSVTFSARTVPAKSAQSFGFLRLLSSSVAANRNLPPNASFVNASLQLLRSDAAAARSIPARVLSSAATFARLVPALLAQRTAPGKTGAVSAVLGKLSAASQAARNIPTGLGTIAAALFALRSSSAATRTSPGKVATSAARFAKLLAGSTAARTVPAGQHPTLPHMRAPAWRTADFGDGSAPVNWLAPLDPAELKAYTIDCSRELTSSRVNRIEGRHLELSGLAVAAGLQIYGSSNDDTTVTIWFNILPEERVKSNWNPPGELHTIICRVTTSDGQIYERDVHLRIRQLGQ